MKTRHKLLERQVRKYLTSLETLSSVQDQDLQKFLTAVSDSYEIFERNHRFLERSAELSSQELIEANRDLRIGRDEIQALCRILTLMNQAPSCMKAACMSVLPEIQNFSEFPIVVVEIFEEDKKEVRLLAQVGVPADFLMKPTEFFWQTLGAQTSISIPIDSPSGIRGLLTLADSRTREISDRFSHWLTVVASQMAAMIEKKRLDDLIEDQKAKIVAASKMSELGKMAGCVAHEINTPLATISLMVEKLQSLLIEGAVDLDEVVRCTEVIELTTGRIAKTVSGLRTFSRDGSSDGMEWVSLEKIVHETLSLCYESFKRKGIELRVEIPPHLEFFCRFTQISQVLLNLLNNSQDALEEFDRKWMSLSVQEQAQEFFLRVTDSGPGLPLEVRNNLFEPFFTTKGVGKGTGLGLSISANIIKSHGGHLEYDENSPHTSFVIRFPKAATRFSVVAA